jgi:hypothetical protein
MALLPKVKLKALPTFPSVIHGGAGIDVTKQNGAVTVDLDFGDFGETSALPLPATSYLLTYDAATGSYVRVPSVLFGGGVSGIADAPVNGTTYARNSAAWVPVLPISQYDTVALATAANVAAPVNALRVAGYYAAGDGGSALYKRVGSLAGNFGFQSADGAWWQLSEPILNVKMFGAKGDGVTDDSLAMYRAHATGHLIHYPAGNYVFSTLTFTAGGISGEGAGNFGTRLFTTDNTAADAITISGPDGVPMIFEHFSLLANSGSKANGAGINIAPSSSELQYAYIDDILIYNIATSVHFTAASHYTVTNSKFLNYTNAGLLVENTSTADSGDSCVSNNLFNSGFAAGSTTGIRQHSSGALKIVNNKFLGGNYGFVFNSNGQASTTDLLFTNNSIENMESAGIVLQRTSGTSVMGSIVIVGNQLNTMPIGIYADTSGFVSQITITGNIVAAQVANGVCISLGTVSKFVITGNVMVGVNSGDTAIITGAGCSLGKIGGNLINNFAIANSLGGTSISTTF